MFAPSGLDAGLLVGAEHVITRPQCCATPAALVEIENTAGLAGEIRIAWEDPCAMPPGAQRVLAEPAPSVVPLIFATMPLAIASRRNSETDQRANGRPRRAGNSQANALIATTILGGKAGWSPASRQFAETRQSHCMRALTPFADDLTWCVEMLRDPVVAEPLACQQHNLRPHNVTIR